MAQLKVPISDFSLTARFKCLVNDTYRFDENGVEYFEKSSSVTEITRAVTQTCKFAYTLPNGATIRSAELHATLGVPLYPPETLTIGSKPVGYGGEVVVDVDIATLTSPFERTFTYKPMQVLHNNGEHSSSGLTPTHTQRGKDYYGDYLYKTYEFQHESTITCTNVYLLIEYNPALDFSGWTDDPLVVGETFVKAVHMTELQQWTAVLSEYADNGTPTFTEAVPGETSLSLWLSQVQEIRAVLDVVSPNHEAWIDVSVNCPRADVMTQLRKIIVAAM